MSRYQCYVNPLLDVFDHGEEAVVELNGQDGGCWLDF